MSNTLIFLIDLIRESLTAKTSKEVMKRISEDEATKQISQKLGDILACLTGFQERIEENVQVVFLYQDVVAARNGVSNAKSNWDKANKSGDETLWLITWAGILDAPSLWDKLFNMDHSLSDKSSSPSGETAIIPYFINRWWARLQNTSDSGYNAVEFQKDWDDLWEAIVTIERIGVSLYLDALGQGRKQDDPKWLAIQQSYIDDSNARTDRWWKFYQDVADAAPSEVRKLLDKHRRIQKT